MPSWKKVIISGSDAALNSLDVTGDLTVDTNTLYVDSADNRVGIGTTNPGYTFEVNGDTWTNTLYVDSTATVDSNLYVSSRIGIGTVTPAEDLHIATAGATAKIDSSNTFARLDMSSANNQYYLQVEDSLFDGIGFYQNSPATTGFKMVLNTNGDIGIGTTSPSEKLDVNGNASISGSLTVSQGGNFTMDGGGTLDTGGGNVNTTGGNLNIGGGALNGTVPGSAVNVDTVTATVKNFVIDHPSEEKAGYKLRHSSLEGPEIGVYFRGKSTENIINLPDYWVDLVDEDSITVNLTSFGSPCQHYIEDIRDNQVIIGCACGTPNYHFTVYGERKDVEKLVVEYKEEKYL